MAEELSEYLKSLYPEADDLLIEYYISLIEDNSQEKLPATKEMKEYAEWIKTKKEAEKKLEELKAKIVEQKQRLGLKFQILNINSITTRTFQPDKFYKWVSTLVDSETLDSITTRTIDEKKFTQLEAKGVIEYDYIPQDCFTSSKSWRVEVSRAKKNE